MSSKTICEMDPWIPYTGHICHGTCWGDVCYMIGHPPRETIFSLSNCSLGFIFKFKDCWNALCYHETFPWIWGCSPWSQSTNYNIGGFQVHEGMKIVIKGIKCLIKSVAVKEFQKVFSEYNFLECRGPCRCEVSIPNHFCYYLPSNMSK